MVFRLHETSGVFSGRFMFLVLLSTKGTIKKRIIACLCRLSTVLALCPRPPEGSYGGYAIPRRLFARPVFYLLYTRGGSFQALSQNMSPLLRGRRMRFLASEYPFFYANLTVYSYYLMYLCGGKEPPSYLDRVSFIEERP